MPIPQEGIHICCCKRGQKTMFGSPMGEATAIVLNALQNNF